MGQNHKIEFEPDVEVRQLLAALDGAERNRYINDAIKAFSIKSASGKVDAQQVSYVSPADAVNAELARIFEGACTAIQAAPADSDAYVGLTETGSQLRAKCMTKDALDILKSLRQPVTQQEVWEILASLV